MTGLYVLRCTGEFCKPRNEVADPYCRVYHKDKLERIPVVPAFGLEVAKEALERIRNYEPSPVAQGVAAEALAKLDQGKESCRDQRD